MKGGVSEAARPEGEKKGPKDVVKGSELVKGGLK